MHKLTALTLLFLAGCAAPQPAAPPPSVRATAAPIYSSAVLDRDRLKGHWVQVAGMGTLPCPPGEVDIADNHIRWTLCLDKSRSGEGPMVPGKPGRFAVKGMADWWLLWVDGDYRTMVVGTPSGQFGFVLNRDANMPADRAKAVRDIMKFNGHDPAKLTFY